MTTYLVPCGTSVLENLRSGRGCTKLGSHVQPLEDWAAKEQINECSPDQWAHSLAYQLAVLAQAQPVDRRRVSAECSSLAQSPGSEPGPGDKVLMLASDTAEGVLAALVNATLLRGPIEFYTGPPLDGRTARRALAQGNGGLTTYIVRVEGLVPRDTTTFTAAMERVGRTLRFAAELDGSIVFHVTGGYKATVPYLVVLTEYVKATVGQVRAFCLHEGDGSSNPPPPVEIFLRSVDGAGDLAEMLAAEKGTLSSTEGRLRGFAYERRPDGTNGLTPLGRAIKALLT